MKITLFYYLEIDLDGVNKDHFKLNYNNHI